ncbi:MAG: hypothetical protein DHS20C02_08860 [Micavibrio sp.]|nr:MAG: hypothetical protein DHS20C02_08860 [Micavibrio sp.]
MPFFFKGDFFSRKKPKKNKKVKQESYAITGRHKDKGYVPDPLLNEPHGELTHADEDDILTKLQEREAELAKENDPDLASKLLKYERELEHQQAEIGRIKKQLTEVEAELGANEERKQKPEESFLITVKHAFIEATGTTLLLAGSVFTPTALDLGNPNLNNIITVNDNNQAGLTLSLDLKKDSMPNITTSPSFSSEPSKKNNTEAITHSTKKSIDGDYNLAQALHILGAYVPLTQVELKKNILMPHKMRGALLLSTLFMPRDLEVGYDFMALFAHHETIGFDKSAVSSTGAISFLQILEKSTLREQLYKFSDRLPPQYQHLGDYIQRYDKNAGQYEWKNKKRVKKKADWGFRVVDDNRKANFVASAKEIDQRLEKIRKVVSNSTAKEFEEFRGKNANKSTEAVLKAVYHNYSKLHWKKQRVREHIERYKDNNRPWRYRVVDSKGRALMHPNKAEIAKRKQEIRTAMMSAEVNSSILATEHMAEKLSRFLKKIKADHPNYTPSYGDGYATWNAGNADAKFLIDMQLNRKTRRKLVKDHRPNLTKNNPKMYNHVALNKDKTAWVHTPASFAGAKQIRDEFFTATPLSQMASENQKIRAQILDILKHHNPDSARTSSVVPYPEVEKEQIKQLETGLREKFPDQAGRVSVTFPGLKSNNSRLSLNDLASEFQPIF